MDRIGFSLNKRSLAIICIGVIFNLMGRSVALYCDLPLYMDSLGTFMTAILLGPLGGAVAGTVMNLIVSLSSFPSWEWLYCLVSISGAFVVGLSLYKKERTDSFKVVGTSVLTGLVMTVVSLPINLFIRDGMTGNLWGDALVEMLEQYVSLKFICCLAGELIVNIPDKIISLMILTLAIVIFRRVGITIIPEEDEEKVSPISGKTLSLIAAGLTVPFLALSFSGKTMAAMSGVEDFAADYATTIYGVYEGLSSAEINTVTQTGDGYIWAGAYSGLYRYNGTNFEQMDLDPRISNAMMLYTDTKGRMWICTNDSGIACYDPYSEELDFFTTEDGLPSDTIHDVCEDSQGNIYVATASYLCRITMQNNTRMYEAGESMMSNGTAPDETAQNVESQNAAEIFVYDYLPDITTVYSLDCVEDDGICGVTGNGLLFLIKDDELLYTLKSDREGDTYLAAGYMEDGQFIVGSDREFLEFVVVTDSGFKRGKSIDTKGLRGFNRLCYSERYSGYFIACQNGIGFVSKLGEVQNLTVPGFDTSVEDVLVDRQGNIWMSSNKQGIIKLSRNPFSDLYKRIGQPAQVVNAILMDGDIAYIASDEGVIKVDVNKKIKLADPALKPLEGSRVRNIMKDSKGNLWFSTYGEYGLVRIDKNGGMTYFTDENSDVIGSRFRVTEELNDGRILAVSLTGISIIDGDRVDAAIGAEDGIDALRALCAVQEADGTIWIGTDGDGVYTIKNNKVSWHWGRDEGLMSGVVMKVVPCSGGRLYVCSNGLYYHEGSSIRKLENFPYSNVYDVFITEDRAVYVTSSAGLYVVKESDLLADEGEYTYALLNSKRGLTTTFTANSYSVLEKDRLILCCTEGVQILNLSDYKNFDQHYQIVIRSVYKDDMEINLENGVYNIPAGQGSIKITPAVLNYTISDPLVRVTLEGVDEEGRVMRQSALETLYYPSLGYGDYNLKVEVLDDSGTEMVKEMTFILHKDAKRYEKGYFKIYLVLVSALLICILVWLASKFGNMAVINHQYDQIREAKEEAEYANQAKSRFLAQMSHEIRTPINAVMGMDEMILRESREPDIRGYAHDIYDAGNVLISIINDILDSSKIESGKMEIIPSEYETKTLVSDLINMTEQHAQSKDLKLEAEIDSNLPMILYGDNVRIRQVITNLLSNAVKYTVSGNVWFRVKGVREGENIHLHVEVEDTGIGIKQEDLPKLFEEYRRIEEGKHRNIEGTGLGMTITVSLLKMMGSHLEVESIYGKGTKFYFDIDQKVIDSTPIGKFDRSRRVERSILDEYEPFTAEDARVLVVDDNSMNRKVFRNLLKPTRVHVSEAASGPESLVKVETEHYDVIFMDHMMPEMDGVEAMKLMRTKECCKDIPIYVLTANVMSGARESYIAEGFDGFIPKPIVAGKLEETLRAALPPEMIHPLTEEEKEKIREEKKDTSNPVPEDLPDVEGLDWNYAWIHLSNRDLLRNGVESFYDVIGIQADRLQKLYVELVTYAGNKNAAKITDVATAENTGDDPVAAYRIQVHGMKSSAATIGIVPLAGMAKVLEFAARAEDVKTIRALHETFLREWRSYEEKLRGVFGLGVAVSLAKGDTAGAAAGNTEELKQVLDPLEQAVIDVDVDKADEIIERLKAVSFGPEIDGEIKKLAGAVADMDEDAAKAVIDLIRKLV